MQYPEDRRSVSLTTPFTARVSDVPAAQAMAGGARAVLAVHTDRDGMCNGCIEAWARLAPFPCEQRRWAQAVLGRG